MKNDLIDRYIYAVTKRLQPKIRDDVQKELYGLVDDMLMERCGDAAPTEKDIRVVLTELGTPQELYAKYDEDSEKCLIGQPYFTTWKLVMRIVLSAVAIGMTVSSLVVFFTESQTWGEMLASWMSLMWGGCLQAFAVVTLIFVGFSRSGVQLGQPFNFDDLPSVPKKKQQISRWECVFGIAGCVVLLALLLAAPEYLVGYWGPDRVIPLFNAQVLSSCWYLILAFGVADIVRSAVRLMEGQYSRRVLIVTLVTNGIAAAAAILWLTAPDLINSVFVTHVREALADEAAFIINIFTHFDRFLLAVILLALGLDTVEAIVKTLKK